MSEYARYVRTADISTFPYPTRYGIPGGHRYDLRERSARPLPEIVDHVRELLAPGAPGRGGSSRSAPRSIRAPGPHRGNTGVEVILNANTLAGSLARSVHTDDPREDARGRGTGIGRSSPQPSPEVIAYLLKRYLN